VQFRGSLRDNSNYNPYEPSLNISRDNYLLYNTEELLYNNIPIIVTYLPKGYTARWCSQEALNIIAIKD
jgi:hypothetical protein